MSKNFKIIFNLIEYLKNFYFEFFFNESADENMFSKSFVQNR